MATVCMMVPVDMAEACREHGGALVRFATLLVGPDDARDVVAEVVAATLSRNSTAFHASSRYADPLPLPIARLHSASINPKR